MNATMTVSWGLALLATALRASRKAARVAFLPLRSLSSLPSSRVPSLGSIAEWSLLVNRSYRALTSASAWGRGLICLSSYLLMPTRMTWVRAFSLSAFSLGASAHAADANASAAVRAVTRQVRDALVMSNGPFGEGQSTPEASRGGGGGVLCGRTGGR